MHNETFITIRTFNQPLDMAVVRSRLEDEGIEVRVLDELTTQVNPFYSNAIGGVKLQVKETDVNVAMEILKDGGYMNDENISSQDNLSKLERVAGGFPLLRGFDPNTRIMILLGILTMAVAALLFLLFSATSGNESVNYP